MASRRLKLTIPTERVHEPIIGTLARTYNVMPNIRMARISDDVGECVLELEGEDEDIESAIGYLGSLDVTVEPASRALWRRS